MPIMEARTSKQLNEEIDRLTSELERVSEALVALRREGRVERDRVAIELETLKRFLLEAHPDLAGRFREIGNRVRQEYSPE